jgi:hypothetical protein
LTAADIDTSDWDKLADVNDKLMAKDATARLFGSSTTATHPGWSCG